MLGVSVAGMTSYEMTPIGFVRSSRALAVDDDWNNETSTIDLIAPFDARALQGLQEFSHAVIVFAFDKASWDDLRMARHPRGNEAWPEVGIFAQRAKDRPNRIGVSTCRILGVEGATVRLQGLDAIDGTPLLDIKPTRRNSVPVALWRNPVGRANSCKGIGISSSMSTYMQPGDPR